MYAAYPSIFLVLIRSGTNPSFCPSSSTKKSIDEYEYYQSSSQRNLLVLLVSYVATHSISTHKEFRFVLPILPLVCIISGKAVEELLLLGLGERGDNSYSSSTNKTVNSIFWQNRSPMALCFIVLTFFLNQPHLVFLSCIHQRASIAVNLAVLDSIRQALNDHVNNKNNINSIDNVDYTVDYLMGCHSTPLYSHLHLSMQQHEHVNIKASSLDCSADCRLAVAAAAPYGSGDEEEGTSSSPSSSTLVATTICESDLFFKDPLTFVMLRYGDDDGNDKSSSDEHSCSYHVNNGNIDIRNTKTTTTTERTTYAVADALALDKVNNSLYCNKPLRNYSSNYKKKEKKKPDYVAVFEEDAKQIGAYLTSSSSFSLSSCDGLNMELYKKLPHKIRSLHIYWEEFIPALRDFWNQEKFSLDKTIHSILEVEYEYMFLYKKRR